MIQQRLRKLCLVLLSLFGTYLLWLALNSWLSVCETALYRQDYEKAMLTTAAISLYVYLALGFAFQKKPFFRAVFNLSPSDYTAANSGLQTNVKPASNRLAPRYR